MEEKNREEPGVLGGLSSTRPERIGRPRASSKRAAPRRQSPAAVRPGAPPLKPHRHAEPPPVSRVPPPKGTELVTTVIQAAGELAQVGLIVSGHALKRAVDRLPRP
jgi:hypothetical protein